MSAIKKFLLILSVILCLILFIGLLLPEEYIIQRSVTVNAQPDEVFNYTGNLHQWKNWWPWAADDSALLLTIDGDGLGKGAVMKWESAKEGNGSIIFLESNPSLGTRYVFETGGGKHQAEGNIYFEKGNGSTRVTWQEKGKLGFNPLMRYTGILMSSVVGKDFEKGLKKLKELVEKESL